MKNWVLGLVFVLAGAGAWASLVGAEEVSPPAGDLIRVIVTVTGLHRAAPPTLAREDVLVYQDSQRRPVVDWEPANSAATSFWSITGRDAWPGWRTRRAVWRFGRALKPRSLSARTCSS